MAITSAPIIPADGTWTISDGGSLSLTIPYRGGDLKLTGLNPDFKSRQVFKAGGRVYSARNVEDQEYGVEFTAHAVGFLGDGSTSTVWEPFMRTGLWSGATSTLPVTAGDAYCLTFTFQAERTNFGSTAGDAKVVIKYVYFDVDFAEGTPATFSFKGTGIPYSTDHYTVSNV